MHLQHPVVTARDTRQLRSFGSGSKSPRAGMGVTCLGADGSLSWAFGLSQVGVRPEPCRSGGLIPCVSRPASAAMLHTLHPS